MIICHSNSQVFGEFANNKFILKKWWFSFEIWTTWIYWILRDIQRAAWNFRSWYELRTAILELFCEVTRSTTDGAVLSVSTQFCPHDQSTVRQPGLVFTSVGDFWLWKQKQTAFLYVVQWRLDVTGCESWFSIDTEEEQIERNEPRIKFLFKVRYLEIWEPRAPVLSVAPWPPCTYICPSCKHDFQAPVPCSPLLGFWSFASDSHFSAKKYRVSRWGRL